MFKGAFKDALYYLAGAQTFLMLIRIPARV